MKTNDWLLWAALGAGVLYVMNEKKKQDAQVWRGPKRVTDKKFGPGKRESAAIVGAASGAAAGAAVGSVVPVVGTGIGALAGGALGALGVRFV